MHGDDVQNNPHKKLCSRKQFTGLINSIVLLILCNNKRVITSCCTPGAGPANFRDGPVRKY